MDHTADRVSAKQRATRRKHKSDRRERQIVRVLALLRVLSRGQTPSVHDLAAEFCTRRETIYRDLRVLQDAGYPITGDGRGRLSHPRLLPGTIPEIRFSPQELEALGAAAAQVQVALPNAGALAAAIVKLESLRNSEPNVDFSSGDRVVDSWLCGVKEYEQHEACIAVLIEAILRQRRCEVEYKKASATHPKTYSFDPYRLLLVGGGLYVVGQVPKYEGVATLSVDRLLSVTLTGVASAIDPEFNISQFRDRAFGVSWQNPEEVVLRFRVDQAPYVRERIWHPTQQLKPLPAGGLQMTFHAGGPFEIRRWILGWGDAVEVISPESLRDEIEQVARSISALYSSSATSHKTRSAISERQA